MADYKEFEEELQSLVETATKALRAILLSKDRTSKHAPYSWKEEDINEHVFKVIGHIAYGAGQFHNYKNPDGEDHLYNAIVRLLMAKWLIDHPTVKQDKLCYFGFEITSCDLCCDCAKRVDSWETCKYGKLYKNKTGR